MNTTQETPDYLTPNQVASILRVDAMTVRKWIKVGILAAKTVKEGKRVRHHVSSRAIDALLDVTRN